jgi:hypothetical protein
MGNGYWELNRERDVIKEFRDAHKIITFKIENPVICGLETLGSHQVNYQILCHIHSQNVGVSSQYRSF